MLQEKLKIAGHTSMAMTDYYTRAAIPETVEFVIIANVEI